MYNRGSITAVKNLEHVEMTKNFVVIPPHIDKISHTRFLTCNYIATGFYLATGVISRNGFNYWTMGKGWHDPYDFIRLELVRKKDCFTDTADKMRIKKRENMENR